MRSLWMEEYRMQRRPALKENMETDTVVIGGGMAGILCSFLLKQRGIDNVVLEAKRVGTGVTQNTTAKITAQHGLAYAKLEKQFGLSEAKTYLEANQQAVEAYRGLAQKFPCDFEEKTAFVYSESDRVKLKKEADTYRRMGLDASLQDRPPIPVKTVGALGMTGQAQFHPVKFLNGLTEGLTIFEDSPVQEIQPGKAVTEGGSVRARRIVLATHFPMVNLRGLYFIKMYQHRSYVLALEGAKDPGGMYIGAEESGYSFRTHEGLLLLGGGGHKTGKKGGGWKELHRVAQAAYPKARERWAWATQDCMTLDSMPYIGRHQKSSRELYVATGFNKWGMTGSMVAATLLADLITQGASPWAKLLDPSRSMLRPQLFVNLGQAVLGLVSFGKRCSHMGCALKWNPQERSWDCPCHGSRFDEEGGLINNPAQKGIKNP